MYEELCSGLETDTNGGRKDTGICRMFSAERKTYSSSVHSSTVVEVDLGDASVRYLDISICSSVLNRLCRKLWEQPEHNIQLKEESCSLQRYLDALEDMPSPRTEQDVLQTNGSRIYNILNGQEG